MDRNKHLFFMRRLLRDIYGDSMLASELKFKGGTAAMFFHGLPRFSTDLDFNLTDPSRQSEVFERMQDIVKKNGVLHDAADKMFGPVLVLDYGVGERKLKIEISNRMFDNHYEILEFPPLSVPVLSRPDMLSHKLCAMREREAPRDVFDVWFFLSKGWEINPYVIRERTGKDVKSFLNGCVGLLDGVSPKDMMMEIGELLDEEMKRKVRDGRLILECKALLEDYAFLPMLSKSVPAKHTEALFRNDTLLPFFVKEKIDPSTVSLQKLEDLLSGKNVILSNRTGNTVSCRLGVDGRIRRKGGMAI